MGAGVTSDFGYVIDCLPAQRREFEAAAAQLRSLAELRERGTARLRSFSALLTDVFCFFYLPEPTLKHEVGGSADRLNHLILKFLLETAQYDQLRGRTMLDFDAALAATERFGGMLLEYLQSGHGGGSGPAPIRPPELVEIDAVELIEKAVAGGEGPIRDGLLVIAKEIEGDLDAHSILTDLCRSWGTEPGFLQELPYQERIALARRIRDNQKLIELARIVGRFRSLAQQKRHTRIVELPHEVFDVTLGSDWNWFLSQELMTLPHRALRYDFYRRLLDGRIGQYDLHGTERVGRGSLVVCVDTSGSMAGTRELVSKAVALALLDIAKLQDRRYVAILFSSPGQWRSYAFANDRVAIRDPGGATRTTSFVEGMLRVGADFFGGGTDYESPLREAIRVLGDDADCKDGDIVFITDDQCEVGEPFLVEYGAAKRERGFSTFSVIIEERVSDARTLRKFSDEVISSFELTEEVAGRIFESV